MNSNNISILNTIHNTNTTNTADTANTVCERAPFDLAENCDPVNVDIQFEIDSLCSLPELPDTEVFPRTTPFNLDIPFVDAPNCIDIQGEGFKFASKEEDCAIGVYTLELSCPIDVYGESEIEITQNDAEEPTGTAKIRIDCDDVDLDIDLNIPCPIDVYAEKSFDITQGGSKGDSTGSGKISLDIDCEKANMDLQLSMPCPISLFISQNLAITQDTQPTSSVIEGEPPPKQKPSGYIKLDINCEKSEMEFDLNIPCPIDVSSNVDINITQNNPAENEKRGPTGSGTLNIDCDNASLDIDLNIPCPIDASANTSIEVTSEGAPGTKPTGTASFDIDCSGATLDIDLNIPCPIDITLGNGGQGGQGGNNDDTPVTAQAEPTWDGSNGTASTTHSNIITINGTLITEFGDPVPVPITGTGNINGKITCDSADLNATIDLGEIKIPIPPCSLLSSCSCSCKDIYLYKNNSTEVSGSTKPVVGVFELNIPCSGEPSVTITAGVGCKHEVSDICTKLSDTNEASVEALSDTSPEESGSDSEAVSEADTVRVDVLGTVGVTYNECDGELKVMHDLYALVPKSEGYECSGSSISKNLGIVVKTTRDEPIGGLDVKYTVDSCDPTSLEFDNKNGSVTIDLTYWDATDIIGTNYEDGISGYIAVNYTPGVGPGMVVSSHLSIKKDYIPDIVRDWVSNNISCGTWSNCGWEYDWSCDDLYGCEDYQVTKNKINNLTDNLQISGRDITIGGDYSSVIVHNTGNWHYEIEVLISKQDLIDAIGFAGM